MWPFRRKQVTVRISNAARADLVRLCQRWGQRGSRRPEDAILFGGAVCDQVEQELRDLGGVPPWAVQIPDKRQRCKFMWKHSGGSKNAIWAVCVVTDSGGPFGLHRSIVVTAFRASPPCAGQPARLPNRPSPGKRAAATRS